MSGRIALQRNAHPAFVTTVRTAHATERELRLGAKETVGLTPGGRVWQQLRRPPGQQSPRRSRRACPDTGLENGQGEPRVRAPLRGSLVAVRDIAGEGDGIADRQLLCTVAHLNLDDACQD